VTLRRGAKRRTRRWLPALVAGLALSACSDEVILEGERFDVRTPLAASLPDADGTVPRAAEVAPPRENRAPPIALPAPVDHAAWTHRGGTPTHRIRHAALAAAPAPLWSVDIGTGDTRRGAITADPVVAGGRVFAMDAENRVSAHSTAGAPLWARTLAPAADAPGEATGGGLAVAAGRLFVATGFGRLHALDAATGAVLWTQGFDAPVAGAPTVAGDLVYVVSRDNRAFAVEVADGRLAWQLPGTPSPSAVLGGAAPAVTDRLAIFPFGSADLVATLRRGGVQVWQAALAGQRVGVAFAGFSDVTGDPVVGGDRVYAGSPSGRIVALDAASGARLWTATEGALSPVWPDGGSVFAVTDASQLVRLDARDGGVIWAVDLPKFKDDRPRRRQGVWAHHGPVLAGGRLVVASGDGLLRFFEPRDGRLAGSVAIPGGATTGPAVVGRTLYVVSSDGRLHAYR